MTTSGSAEASPTDAPPSAAETLPLLLRVRRLLGRIRRRFTVDTFDIFVRRVPEQPEFEAPEGYAFRWATPEDILGCDPYHTELDDGERSRGAKRIGFGHQAVVASHGDAIVFSMWANPRNLNVPGLMKRRLGPHQTFIYKAFTSPDHRGRKLYEAGMRFVLDDMAANGKTELVGYAHLKKQISRKGLAALRFESVGKVRQLSVPGLRRTFVSRELASHFPESADRSRVLDADDAA